MRTGERPEKGQCSQSECYGIAVWEKMDTCV